MEHRNVSQGMKCGTQGKDLYRNVVGFKEVRIDPGAALVIKDVEPRTSNMPRLERVDKRWSIHN